MPDPLKHHEQPVLPAGEETVPTDLVSEPNGAHRGRSPSRI